MKAYTQESRRKKAIKTENRLRVALYYAFQLLVDVIIILIFVVNKINGVIILLLGQMFIKMAD